MPAAWMYVAAAALALPAGWLGCVLFDRVPENRPLFRPLEPVRLGGRYGAIHLATLGLFLVAVWRFGEEGIGVTAVYLACFTIFVALSAIDFDTFRLPDPIVVPFLVVSLPLITLVSILSKDTAAIRYAIAGGCFYFGFLLLAHLPFPRGMGFGDVKLGAVMGLYCGLTATDYVTSLSLVLYAMIIGFLTGSMVGIVLFAFRRRSRPYPFGPFLVFGATLAIVFSQQLVPATVLG